MTFVCTKCLNESSIIVEGVQIIECGCNKCSGIMIRKVTINLHKALAEV